MRGARPDNRNKKQETRIKNQEGLNQFYWNPVKWKKYSMSSAKESFSPEMIKIFKIFGLGSLFFVLFLSFFNEKRANNTGSEPSEFNVSDAERLFFRNLRASYYDIEDRRDAKITIYRHKKRFQSEVQPYFNFVIMYSRMLSEAYLFFEVFPDDYPVFLQLENQNGTIKELEFNGGNKFDHFDFSMQFFENFGENTQVRLKVGDTWETVLEDEKDRDILKTVFSDYFRLVNRSM